ncbi:MAG: hypothetical protein R6U95_05305, partial [Bacteroidales bacterium]
MVSYGGWSKSDAEAYFKTAVLDNAISHEIDFTLQQTRYVRNKFPAITVAPLLYDVDNHLLHWIHE